MTAPKLAKRKECTGCLACVDTCTHNALSSYIGNDGHYYVQINNQVCVGCLQCEKICPVVGRLQFDKSERADFYASWNTNTDERKQSASGGVFSAMAHYIIDHGGIVIGAALDNCYDVKHKVVSSGDNLKQLQGSKYIQSNTSGIYKQALGLLKNGKLVLFSGTGCQVAGLLSYLKDKKYEGRLVTVDLICGGVPSRLLLKKFVENEPYQVEKIISFRTKDTGWKPKGFLYNLKVEDGDGQVHNYAGKKNLVTTGFSLELTERYSCYNCRFVGKNRLSDFTIGDLWGDTMYPEEHFDGLSLLVVHNQNALDLLLDMRDYLHTAPCDEKLAIKANSRLVNGQNVRAYTWERHFMERLFTNCSYETLKKIYTNDYNLYSPWMIVKVIRFFYIRLLKGI